MQNNNGVESDGLFVKKIKIFNKLGLHARPAAMLVQTVSKFENDIHVSKGSKKVNAKSIMGVMMLAAGPNTVLVFEIGDPEPEKAWEAIEDLFNRNFDE